MTSYVLNKGEITPVVLADHSNDCDTVDHETITKLHYLSFSKQKLQLWSSIIKQILIDQFDDQRSDFLFDLWSSNKKHIGILQDPCGIISSEETRLWEQYFVT